MRRWWRGIYADHRDRTRREESPRRFSCSAALRCYDEARLRSAWPAPDGRGRPAPARRGRAATGLGHRPLVTFAFRRKPRIQVENAVAVGNITRSRCTSAIGRRQRNVAPPSALFSARIEPPCAVTIERLMASPRPRPCVAERHERLEHPLELALGNPGAAVGRRAAGRSRRSARSPASSCRSARGACRPSRRTRSSPG